MESPGRPKRILVIEDETPLLEAINLKLKHSGYEVLQARTAEEGLSYLNSINPIDLIWLDHYLLGKEDGIDIVTTIRARESLKNIPIFVVSNTASPEKVEAYKQLGVSRYYTKSDHRLEEIVSDIEAYLTPKL